MLQITGLKRTRSSSSSSSKLRKPDNTVNAKWIERVLKKAQRGTHVIIDATRVGCPNSATVKALLKLIVERGIIGDHVRTVKIKNFRFTALPVGFGGASVTELSLEANRLGDDAVQALTVERFPKLRTLNLSHNCLTVVPASHAKELDLTQNSICELDFSQLPNITHLVIDDQLRDVLTGYGRDVELPVSLVDISAANNALPPPPTWFCKRLSASNVFHFNLEENMLAHPQTGEDWPGQIGSLMYDCQSYQRFA